VTNGLWFAAYLLTLAAVAAAMVHGRSVSLTAYGTPAAQTDWDVWRADTKKMAEQPGIVKRREAKSVEPPALVLMRDYFAVCLAGALLLSSVLFATFMFFIRGALADGRRVGPASAARAGPP
jgi:hypothetical protein